ncbi:MAG: HIT family protein [Chloroflexi bacterium]|nr:HIT family protein [Chloroflexota bacterium]
MKSELSTWYDRVTRSACFVCRIVEGRPLFPNPRIVYEDDSVIAFLNQFPSQEGYTIVCPKRHDERFEMDLSLEEWAHLQRVVRDLARAVADATGAMRMYIASLGSPERNAHLHIHVCPCPAGTPFEKQQFAAMDLRGGQALLTLSDARLDELAGSIRQAMPA